VVEALLALKFRVDYANTTLEVQGRYRFLPSPYRSYKNNPGYVRHYDGVTYRYNNYGFREDEDMDLSTKEPDEFRVFFLGGSAAYGGRAREFGQYQLISGQKTYLSSQTISAYLEDELARALPERKVRVINGAVNNYRIHNVYLTYLELLRTLSPDLLITMDGWNEIWNLENPYSDPVLDPSERGGGGLAVWLRQHSYTLFYLGNAFRESYLFARLSRNFLVELTDDDFARMDVAEIRRGFEQRTATAEPREEALRGGLLHVYESFWHATRLDGVPILFTIQPVLTLDRVKPLTPREEKLLKYLWHLDSHHPQIVYLAARLRERASRDPEFHFLSLLDVLRDFPGDAYTDYCHLTPAANRHLAARLAEYVLSVPDWTAPRSGVPGPLAGARALTPGRGGEPVPGRPGPR
jgi:hypothetical protein